MNSNTLKKYFEKDTFLNIWNEYLHEIDFVQVVYRKSMQNLDSNNFEQQLLTAFSITAIPQAHNKPPMSLYIYIRVIQDLSLRIEQPLPVKLSLQGFFKGSKVHFHISSDTLNTVVSLIHSSELSLFCLNYYSNILESSPRFPLVAVSNMKSRSSKERKFSIFSYFV